MQALLFTSCLILDKINFSKALFPFFVSKNNIDAFLIGVMGASVREALSIMTGLSQVLSGLYIHTIYIQTGKQIIFVSLLMKSFKIL